MMKYHEIRNQLTIDCCPHCGRANPTLVMEPKPFTTDNNRKNKKRWWGVYACRSCGGVVTACSPCSKDNQPHAECISAIYPSTEEISEDIPAKPREILKQAQNSIHAPIGAVMLCASAVDAMLKEKEYVDDTLYKRIQQAVANHLITSEMETWAHEIRLDANDQRHADENASLPTEEDAKKSLAFALALAEYLFVLPAKVTRGMNNPS